MIRETVTKNQCQHKTLLPGEPRAGLSQWIGAQRWFCGYQIGKAEQ